MKAIVKETQEEVDVFQDAPAIYKEFKSIREWREDELIFPSESIAKFNKTFLEGWVTGFKAKLEEERQANSRKLMHNANAPITSISVAATASYYTGAEYVLNELEKLLNNT